MALLFQYREGRGNRPLGMAPTYQPFLPYFYVSLSFGAIHPILAFFLKKTWSASLLSMPEVITKINMCCAGAGSRTPFIWTRLDGSRVRGLFACKLAPAPF